MARGGPISLFPRAMNFYYRGTWKVEFRGVVELRNSVEMLHYSITATTVKLTPESVESYSVQSEIRLDMPHYERTFENSFAENGVNMSFFFFVSCYASMQVENETFWCNDHALLTSFSILWLMVTAGKELLTFWTQAGILQPRLLWW
jgi:hypothetical protein